MTKKQNGPPKLPVQQLAILAIARFAEPVASTSVFPYLPEMIESFGIPSKDVAKWAGITSAVFSLSQCATAVAWGRASDRHGRKPIILTCLTITMLTSFFWGLSQSLTWAIIARALSGGGNGNVGILRTTVAELCPEKELQPRAFSLMPLVWSIGSIFGPAFGGLLAKPAENFPGVFGNNKFLIKFPYALPNLVAGVFFCISITVGFLFLKETLESKKHRRDYGIILGKKLIALFKGEKRKSHHHRPHITGDDETSPLLRPESITSTSTGYDPDWKPPQKQLSPPSMTEVFTRQSVLNLMAYTFLALHSIAFDQLLPVYMHHPFSPPDPSRSNPFQFSGGFGLKHSRIGLYFTAYGICGGIVQFLLFPPVARRFGILNCFRACSIAYPIIYFITPFCSLIRDPTTQQIAIFVVMLCKCVAGIFGFPCSTILLTNSALTLRVLGTLNGFATSFSAVGRAAGPAIAGSLFTVGVKKGFVILPWWTLSALALLGTLPVFMLVEMQGFSRTDDTDSEEEEDDENEEMEEDDGVLEERSPRPERTRTVSYGSIVREDGIEEEEAADGLVEGPSLTRLASRSSRNSSMRRKRRMSSPISIPGGSIGPGGARKLSNGIGFSNQGQSTLGASFS